LQVAVRFGAVNFCRELPQILPTACGMISKIALKQVITAFGEALPNHYFVGKKYGSPLSFFYFSTLSKTM